MGQTKTTLGNIGGDHSNEETITFDKLKTTPDQLLFEAQQVIAYSEMQLDDDVCKANCRDWLKKYKEFKDAKP